MNSKKIAGIICEYNPFHNGHAYQINELRCRGYETIVCVMSGHFVQRGEFAVADKYLRAECALRAGADLVLELPFPYACAGAETFARAAIAILHEAGVGTVCFGSECGNAEMLAQAAAICEEDAFVKAYRRISTSSCGMAKAYFDAYESVCGQPLPGGANDLLGIAYLRAIAAYGFDMEACVLKREGMDYRAATSDSSDAYPSALMLRECIRREGLCQTVKKHMPSASFALLQKAVKERKAPVFTEHAGNVLLGFFRLMNPQQLHSIYGMEGGLAERLCKTADSCLSYDTWIAKASGKKYTASRIRRAIFAAVTGVTASDVSAGPAYATVLGFRSRGRALLAERRKEEKKIPFVVKPADAVCIGERAIRQSELTKKAESLYTLFLPDPVESGFYFCHSPVCILDEI